ncbi:alginate O-acetyltransferase AlgX-related protein [Solidesulfovibrio sp.]
MAISLRRKAIHTAAVTVFLLCIFLPGADNIFHFAPPVDLMENDPTPLPEFSLSQVFRTFNVFQRGYLEKTYGFRKQLVRWQNILELFWLQSSSHYQAVIRGRGNWLFLAQENAELNVVEDYRSGRLFSPRDLARWVEIYRERQDGLAARGIRYLIVVAPNKHTVYPEFLPPQYNRANPLSRTDQLVTALEAAGLDILDLRPTMLKVKEGALAYYRTDTHWTSFGAFAGYIEIMKRLARWYPDFEPTIRGDYDITITPGLTGGLSSMLALSDLFPEDRVTFVPRTPRRASEVCNDLVVKSLFQPTVVTETGDPGLPTAVIFRDSFAHELMPFLSENFNRAVYLWPYPSTPRELRVFDWAAVDAVKPDLVIDEFVERYFTEYPGHDRSRP